MRHGAVGGSLRGEARTSSYELVSHLARNKVRIRSASESALAEQRTASGVGVSAVRAGGATYLYAKVLQRRD